MSPQTVQRKQISANSVLSNVDYLYLPERNNKACKNMLGASGHRCGSTCRSTPEDTEPTARLAALHKLPVQAGWPALTSFANSVSCQTNQRKNISAHMFLSNLVGLYLAEKE